ncbi:hypothetical protein QAD02_008742 [Eretmocerus hayati]|uniref:Uncharacterized protein n=1 Tax=Eretmocerus hayati TaxID=131215 RepID=A0ACC2NBS6_9HYME|nr:hypothetical protein QAD02_008742 [Eretmocerus hayati]
MTLSNRILWLLMTYIALFNLSGIQGSSDGFERSPRILGGFNASIEDYPFMVSIRYPRTHACGGVIISSNIILTAAQCIVEDYFLDLFYVKVGDSAINYKGTWHKVAKVIKHEGYRRLLVQEGDSIYYQKVNDIALLKLVKPIKIDNKKTGIIQLFKRSDEVHHHDSGVLSGWGKRRKIVDRSVPNPKGKGNITRKELVTRYPENLEIVQLDIGSVYKCFELHPRANLASQFCTYTLGRVPCEGDFGSPLIVDGKVAGLASWTSGECNGDSNVAYFTDVAKFYGWIEKNMEQLRDTYFDSAHHLSTDIYEDFQDIII